MVRFANGRARGKAEKPPSLAAEFADGQYRHPPGFTNASTVERRHCTIQLKYAHVYTTREGSLRTARNFSESSTNVVVLWTHTCDL